MLANALLLLLYISLMSFVLPAEQNDIRKNPTFRSQFHEMCAKVGVDPLASNKGFWAKLLGIGDFYCELGQFNRLSLKSHIYIHMLQCVITTLSLSCQPLLCICTMSLC